MKPQLRILSLILLFSPTALMAQKISSSALIAAQSQQHASQHRTQGLAEDGSISALIRISTPETIAHLQDMGIAIRSSIGNRILTATLPAGLLQAVADLEGVERIELSQPVTAKMDVARSEAGADLAQQGAGNLQHGYSGKGVILGVVDRGFEYTHLNFKAKDGSTPRLLCAWNQVVNGQAPAGYEYGTEYKNYEAAARQVNDKVTSSMHGTHVAGIAAGADMTSPYYGVAPESDLIFVTYQSNSNEVVDGVKYIFDKATAAGRPCVINLSLGAHDGPHDGTSLTDQAYELMTGPGRIIIGAVGNEGATKGHVSKKITANDPMLLLPGAEKKVFACNFWGETGKDFYIQPITVNTLKGTIAAYGEKLFCSSNSSATQTFNNNEHKVAGTVNLAATFNPDNGKGNCAVMATQESQVTGCVFGLLIGTDDEDCVIHGWNNRALDFTVNAKCRAAGFTEGDNHNMMTEIGGTSKAIVSVGSYNSRNTYTDSNGNRREWGAGMFPIAELSNFSSCGPTIDGRMKPEVCAPGAGIISSVQRYAVDTQNCAYTVKDNKGETYYYEINAGTSMAAPYVAGSVALWLEANPTLTPEDVRSIIRRTSRQDAYTGNTPNTGWGYGKIDTLAGLQLAANYYYEPDPEPSPEPDGIVAVTTESHNLRVAYDRSSRQLTSILPGTTIEVYDTAGQLMSTGTDLSRLAAGTYIIRLRHGHETAVQKILL